MRDLLLYSALLLTFLAFGQERKPEEFGYRLLEYSFNGDPVDILIKSKAGEEHMKKPLFFMCQGSLAQPLVKYVDDSAKHYRIFPYTDSYLDQYHIIIVGKPYVPVVAKAETLQPNSLVYVDETGRVPKAYTDRNYLSYYVDRNIEVLEFLQQQAWVDSTRIVVAGHSEGSTIAAKMAADYNRITHLIYSGGNPMGRIMSIISERRYTETPDNLEAEDTFDYWNWVVENKEDLNGEQGDSGRATYEFSIPSIQHLEQLKIPVLVTYGTKDWSAPFNDYLRVETIREGKTNFTFKPFVGTEHNFFPVDAQNRADYQAGGQWNKVVETWLSWLDNN